MLEEQLADARARCSALRELERDNFLLRQKLMDLEGVGTVQRYSKALWTDIAVYKPIVLRLEVCGFVMIATFAQFNRGI